MDFVFKSSDDPVYWRIYASHGLTEWQVIPYNMQILWHIGLFRYFSYVVWILSTATSNWQDLSTIALGLSQWGRNNMADIMQLTHSNAFIE